MKDSSSLSDQAQSSFLALTNHGRREGVIGVQKEFSDRHQTVRLHHPSYFPQGLFLLVNFAKHRDKKYSVEVTVGVRNLLGPSNLTFYA